MTEFKRDFFKVDPVFSKLHELLLKVHATPWHTQKQLIENSHVKDFCVLTRHFMDLPGDNHIYLHYDTSSWFKAPAGVAIRIDAIGVYDNRGEYEIARNNQLNSTNKSVNHNLN